LFCAQSLCKLDQMTTLHEVMADAAVAKKIQ
jgi:hypothetical protein